MDTVALLTYAQAATLAIPVNATPQSTTSNGTPTPSGGSGAGTETFDTVLGYYQTTLVTGRRYMAITTGLIANGGVVGDQYSLQIRDSGSSSNPTSASTLVAQTTWGVAATGGGGRIPIFLANTFVASSTGVHTFGFSATRTAGTGQFTPVTSNLRELFVIYMGIV